MINIGDKIHIFDGTEIKITGIKEQETFVGARLYNISCQQEDIEDAIPMIIYDDGIVFCPSDWQTIPDDYSDISWIELQTGRHAIMYDGLPKLFP